MPLPVIALPAFLTLVRQVGLTVAKRQVKKRLAKGFLTKNANKINNAQKSFLNKAPKGGKGGPSKVKSNKKTKINANKNEGKPTSKPKPTSTTKPKTTTTGTTKPGTKSKIPSFLIGAGIVGGGTAIIKGTGDKGKGGGDMTFGQAFAKARKGEAGRVG